MEPSLEHAHSLAAPYSLEWFGVWFLHVFEFELARYAIAAFGAFAIVNVLLARALSERKIRPASPPRAQLLREIAASVRTCAVYAGISLFTIAGIEAGVLRSYDDPAALGWGWFWASIVVLIVLHDAFFYWTHRLMHDPRMFRRFHRLHHKSHNPSPFTAYSFDVPEAAVHGVFVTLALVFIPVSQPAIFIFLAHMILRNVIGHSGYEVFPARRDGRPVFDFMTTVTHHDLHHAQAGWNYGLYFTWWDRLMKTEHPLYAEKFAAAVRRPLDGSAVRAQQAPGVTDWKDEGAGEGACAARSFTATNDSRLVALDAKTGAIAVGADVDLVSPGEFRITSPPR
jgi:Delta7-sterol 5-desaturase